MAEDAGEAGKSSEKKLTARLNNLNWRKEIELGIWPI
jgi:hypothetical protein